METFVIIFSGNKGVQMATQRASNFIAKATVIALKEKLTELNLDTTGNKAALIIRLQSVVEKLSEAELNQLFPESFFEVTEDENSLNNDATNLRSNEEENLHDVDAELSELRQIWLKKQEIAELKRKISDLNGTSEDTVTPHGAFNFRDVEESLPQFSGDDNYCVRKWLHDFEESADLLEWNDKRRYVYAKRLLVGTAKYFLRTTSCRSWLELKNALIREFNRKITNAEVHNRLRKRKKEKSESLQRYVLCMQEISSLSSVEESDLIQYIIDGIPGSEQSKLLLYNANTLQDLKVALRKFDKFTSHTSSTSYTSSASNAPVKSRLNHGPNKDDSQVKTNIKCFNCNGIGHMSSACKKPRRPKGSCFKCGDPEHKAHECGATKSAVMSVCNSEGAPSIPPVPPKHQDQQLYVHNLQNEFESILRYNFIIGQEDNFDYSCSLETLLDSGSPISFIQRKYLPDFLINTTKPDNGEKFCGINGSPLSIEGSTLVNLDFNDKKIKLNLYVVKDNSMMHPVILGRNFLKMCNLKFEIGCKTYLEHQEQLVNPNRCTHVRDTANFENEILNIDIIEEENLPDIKVGDNIPLPIKSKLFELVSEASFRNGTVKTDDNAKSVQMEIILTKTNPFYCKPRRLPYSHRVELQKIINNLLEKEIIRESNSPYASPIVLVQKKNREFRLCVDYRELNKNTVRENYPLPVIEDLLDRLHEKKYFTILDLRNGFHHVNVASESVKFTSFITPIGQFEYLKMPFGLKNAPSVFQRYINNIFKDLIIADKVFIYLDDILVATKSLSEHIATLELVFEKIKRNCLQLRLDKCKFLYEEISYLGYIVNVSGIRPNRDNLRAIDEFPIPKTIKDVHSFLGLCSYFRKFVRNFANIAKPLYDLLRKNAVFKFERNELDAFEVLKSNLLDSPILSIYSPAKETELHCDASSIGFGAILLQKQSDGKFHPIFYFSKRATDVESRYHSYELETLSMIYALRRFRIYLIGIKFKIVTDCKSLTLTLNKKLLNPRISRWALELQDFDYVVEHRSGTRMSHVDALSRANHILIVEEGSFDFALATAQKRDTNIAKLMSELEIGHNKNYTLVNGLVYRKYNKDVRFYVPENMVERVVSTHHENLCHVGVDKCFDYLKKSYWFPNMKSRIKKILGTCLKCAHFQPSSGKTEGMLHNIPKGNIPFDVLHIDHLGPLPTGKTKNKHIFLVVDGFTKFVKLYAVNTTSSKESILCLKSYFETYSRPNKITSDRATCFVSEEFSNFLAENNIIHVKVATHSPQSNGQAERVNRVLIPMLSKECEEDTTANWYKKLTKIEFAINNTVNKSTGFSPSTLLFGVNQKGEVCDRIMEYMQTRNQNPNRDLLQIRREASDSIKKAQNQNKNYFDQKHKEARKYSEGDLVMIKNVVTTAGVNKKLAPKYRGPYEIYKILPNDRYLIRDVEGLQLTRLPYEGICAPANMKPYILNVCEV